MYGAIIGDIVGSRFEFNNIKTKDFEFFHPKCYYTDDTVMTLAVAQAIMRYRSANTQFKKELVLSMKELGHAYPGAGYGSRFKRWLCSNHAKPYKSYGNGAAMRVSPCGWAAATKAEAIDLGYDSAAVTHNHPEGLDGAAITSQLIWLARNGGTKDDIRAIGDKVYGLNFTLEQIRPSYKFEESCQGTVPQAIVAFLEADSFEDTIRNAISIGGDSDTLAAIAGSIAEPFFGVPSDLIDKARTYLDDRLLGILDAFDEAIEYDNNANDICIGCPCANTSLCTNIYAEGRNCDKI